MSSVRILDHFSQLLGDRVGLFVYLDMFSGGSSPVPSPSFSVPGMKEHVTDLNLLFLFSALIDSFLYIYVY